MKNEQVIMINAIEVVTAVLVTFQNTEMLYNFSMLM